MSKRYLLFSAVVSAGLFYPGLVHAGGGFEPGISEADRPAQFLTPDEIHEWISETCADAGNEALPPDDEDGYLPPGDGEDCGPPEDSDYGDGDFEFPDDEDFSPTDDFGGDDFEDNEVEYRNLADNDPEQHLTEPVLQCALDLIVDLFQQGLIWAPDFGRLHHDFELGLVHERAFREGFEKGRNNGLAQCGLNGEPNPEPGDDQPADGDNVELCHMPPGNPENAHTISVGAAAVDAHLAHGDYLGACEDQPEDSEPAEDQGNKGKKRGSKKHKRGQGKRR